jgi:succinate dehydrogenase / fumarate reductase iron-sulfur subunit
VERSQEFRKCIECFLCQNVCHVVRDHEENKPAFSGPRLFIRAAELDMHPLDTRTDRKEYSQAAQGLGYCNITKCCTEVCPEHIKITDNAIIPMKERVVDRRYDPIVWLGKKILRRDQVDGNGTPDTTVGHVRPDESHAAGGVNWHRAVPAGQPATVGEDGKLPLTELTFDRAGAASPFGDDVEFPLRTDDLNYHHPGDDKV